MAKKRNWKKQTLVFPASTRAEPSAAALPPFPLRKTPRDTFIRRSSAGLRPSTRRPSGLTHSGPDLSPRINRERRDDEAEKENKKREILFDGRCVLKLADE